MTSIFDLKTMTDHFIQAVDSGDLILDAYCTGYLELSSILDSLGRLMYFILRDVGQKLDILNSLRDPSNHPSDFCDHYKTLQAMCAHEESMYKDTTHRQNNLGCRNLLRLHRALLFIIDLFQKVCNEPSETTLSELARTAYDGTLSKHHPWAVRRAVGVAFLALPYRDQFVKAIVASQPVENNLGEETACREYLTGVTLPAMQKAYDVTQQLFEGFNMLDLP